MAFESNYVTMIGNLTDDPELRFTPSGAAVCGFRIASNRRYTDRSGQQQEVAAVAVGDVDDVTGQAEVVDLLLEDHLHVRHLLSEPRRG